MGIVFSNGRKHINQCPSICLLFLDFSYPSHYVFHLCLFYEYDLISICIIHLNIIFLSLSAVAVQIFQ